ncbi:MAG: hypothetical protein R3D99_01960 [Altererythrobacter sp.]
MGLLLLVAVGAVLGWLASIINQPANGRNDYVLIGIGVVSATLAGLAVYDGPILAGLSPRGFVASALASALVLLLVALNRDAGRAGDTGNRR